MTSNNNLTADRETEQYARDWHRMMVRIWTDRLAMMDVHDTGALQRSVMEAGFSARGTDLALTYQFLRYGLYVDAGTGNGYKRGNGGQLDILDRDYRRRHRLGPRRQRRPWFSVSWRISVEVLKNHMARAYGQEFARAFDNL